MAHLVLGVLIRGDDGSRTDYGFDLILLVLCL